MDNQNKTQLLFNLIDELCDSGFSQKQDLINEWINKLREIYADGYRHSYTDIFFHLQKLFLSNDTEILETLGENINCLRNALLGLKEIDKTIDITGVLESYNKFADHINLEIARYNYITTRLVMKETDSDSDSNTVEQSASKERLDKIEQQINKISKDIDASRPITVRAQKAIDGIDKKMEDNKISSITALTIFSAVILAFSGGITFEAGIFKGMADSSPYRLLAVISLTGFILFNTIFVLLYLVGKLAGKPISTKCKYLLLDESGSKPKCGDGYCNKERNSVTLFCRLTHKYSYVLLVNIILLWLMYADYTVWALRDNSIYLRIAVTISPLFVVLVAVSLGRLIKQKILEKRVTTKIKKDILVDILEPVPNNLYQSIVKALSSEHWGEKTIKDRYDDKVRLMPRSTRLERRKIIKELNGFSKQETFSSRYLNTYVSSAEHRRNVYNYRRLKREYLKALASNKK